MSAVRLFVLFSFVSVTFAATIPFHSGPPACDPNTGIGCLPSPDDCPEGCACNRTEFVIDNTETNSLRRPSEKTEFKFVRTITNYGSAGLSARLHEKVQHVFHGIIVSAILFIVCACICVVSVCVYCCHIRRTDYKLKHEVDALAKKLKIDVSKKAGPSTTQLRDHKGESCNVIVQDADVMCV